MNLVYMHRYIVIVQLREHSNFGTRWEWVASRPGRFTSGARLQYLMNRRPGRTPVPVWTLLRWYSAAVAILLIVLVIITIIIIIIRRKNMMTMVIVMKRMIHHKTGVNLTEELTVCYMVHIWGQCLISTLFMKHCLWCGTAGLCMSVPVRISKSAVNVYVK
jgi:hypothetical protein